MACNLGLKTKKSDANKTPPDLALRVRTAEHQVMMNDHVGDHGSYEIVRSHSGSDFDVTMVDVGDGFHALISTMMGDSI